MMFAMAFPAPATGAIAKPSLEIFGVHLGSAEITRANDRYLYSQWGLDGD